MKISLFIILLLFTKLSVAQDLSGIWRGSFYSSEKLLNILSTEDRYKLEVQLDQSSKSLQGVSYSYKTTVFYGKAVANGKINITTGKVRLEELKIVEIRMQENSYACVMTYYLQYSKNGNEEILEGEYSSYGERDSLPCGKGKVYLRKVSTSDFYKEPFLVRRELEKQKNKTGLSPIAPRKVKIGPPIAKNNIADSKTKAVTPKTSGNNTASGKKTAGPPLTGSGIKSPEKKPVPGQTKLFRLHTDPIRNQQQKLSALRILPESWLTQNP